MSKEPNNDQALSLTNTKKRLCLILSSSDLYCYLQANPKEWRLGDKHDKVGIILTMIKLGYQVELVRDKKAIEIMEYFDELIDDERLNKFESIVLFILSHGNKNGVIYGIDGNPINITKHILHKLNQSPYLRGKEKVIFINACRGGNH
jgi:hypothetical protein